MRKTHHDARAVLTVCGLSLARDFHSLPSATVERLLVHADDWKYRKPKNANGSRARYFHAYLVRLATKES